MASVEELLAKYGDTEPETTPPSPGEPAPSMAPEPAPEPRAETSAATNRDGRRLVADYPTPEPASEPDEAPRIDDFALPADDNPFGPSAPVPSPMSAPTSLPQETYTPTDATYHTQVFYQVTPETDASQGADGYNDPDAYGTPTNNERAEYTGYDTGVATDEYTSDPAPAHYDTAYTYAEETPQQQPTHDPYSETPAYTETTPTLPPTPAEAHAGLAALSVALFPPFGAVAIHHAFRTLTTAYSGDIAGSKSHSSKTLAWATAALIAGVLLIVLLIIYRYNPGVYDTIFSKLGFLGAGE